MDVQRRGVLALGVAGVGAAGLTAVGVSIAGPASAAVVGGTATETMLLTGADADNTVNWDFFCTTGRNSGSWKTIPTPSNWESHGFGTYTYGGSLVPQEQGRYRQSFAPPTTWAGKRVYLVFEAAMTDTEAWVNGTSVGPRHQGGFYRFRYDVTNLLKLGQSNLLEVTVTKDSTNASVNNAERKGDYWNFGGIFRPVSLQAVPVAHVDRVAVNAKASGSVTVDVFLDGVTLAGKVVGQVRRLDGTAVGGPITANVASGATKVTLSGTVAGPALWTAETPNLYQVDVQLYAGSQAVHGITERFGFRTIEVRAGDGVYLNGKKIILKGADRHTFWPTLGRASSPRIARQDILLMKEMNMNAVRMSHYPPDGYFLDLCDELGLYVLDELAGWHGSYDTTVGAPLVQAMVTRDVNHPSILFWDNGNEGGWNTALDDDYATWDPQHRAVLHPWAFHDGVETSHYQTYAGTKSILAGSNVFLPTEFLHGLYDGGAGAGLNDYWKLMGVAPRSAGGFIWALVDEAVVRDDRGGALDTNGNTAPDGILGPFREKEGSFFTIKEIWSPVQLNSPMYYASTFPSGFDGTVKIVNRYDFTNTKLCTFSWSLIRYVTPGGTATGHTVVAQGTVAGPDAAPGAVGTITLGLPATWNQSDALTLTATDPAGRDLYTWVWTIAKAPDYAKRLVTAVPGAPAVTATESSTSITMTAGTTKVTISKSTGRLTGVTRNGVAVSLSNGPTLATGTSTLSTVTSTQDGTARVVQATYTGDLSLVRWRLHASGWLQVEYQYHLTGNHDYLGVSFDYPESKVRGVTWLGQGPYRVWKNRLRGVTTDVWTKQYNDTATGSSGWQYPEFKGYHANLYWAALRTAEGTITMVAAEENLFLRLFTPASGPTPKNATATFPAGGISFLDGVSAIGNKFHAAVDVGPESQPNVATGDYHRSVYLRFDA